MKITNVKRDGNTVIFKFAGKVFGITFNAGNLKHIEVLTFGETCVLAEHVKSNPEFFLNLALKSV